MAQTLTDVPGLPSPAEIAEKQAEQSADRTAVAFDPPAFDKFAGYYELWPTAIFRVFRDGSQYFAQLSGQGPVEQFPESQTQFFAKVVHAQISFTTDSQGAVTGLVLHQGGFDMPAKRISPAQAVGMETDQARRIATNTPSAGTEASVRRFFLSLEQGEPNFQEMSIPLAAALRQQWPATQPKIKQLGALQSVKFKWVDPRGFDVYEVDFEHGKVQCGISPLTQDGKVSGRFWSQLP